MPMCSEVQGYREWDRVAALLIENRPAGQQASRVLAAEYEVVVREGADDVGNSRALVRFR